MDILPENLAEGLREKYPVLDHLTDDVDRDELLNAIFEVSPWWVVGQAINHVGWFDSGFPLTDDQLYLSEWQNTRRDIFNIIDLVNWMDDDRLAGKVLISFHEECETFVYRGGLFMIHDIEDDSYYAHDPFEEKFKNFNHYWEGRNHLYEIYRYNFDCQDSYITQ